MRITDTTVSKELWLCHKHFGWSLEKIKDILIAGFKSAFIPQREKSDLLKQVVKELDTFKEPTNGKQLPDRKQPDHHQAGGNALEPEAVEERDIPTTEIIR